MKTDIPKVRRPDPRPGIRSVQYISVHNGRFNSIEAEIVDETLACITLNGLELANFMCSPEGLDSLAIGFIYNEGFIDTIDEVASLHISNNYCVDIWINKEFDPPNRLIVTAGCGGGITFDDLSSRHAPIELGHTETTPEDLSKLMKEVHLGSMLYRRAGGIHTAALSDGKDILYQVEDMGRHNCIDKLAGAALQNRTDTRGKILFCSGRISSEMINKIRRLNIPIVCSRTSPTSLSVKLAGEWNITIVGYLHKNKMRVYSVPERIKTNQRSKT